MSATWESALTKSGLEETEALEMVAALEEMEPEDVKAALQGMWKLRICFT